MRRIEDYALIGDTRSAALVSTDGSIDWWCVPCFDSSACFAALLGGPEHGRFRLRPRAPDARTRRRYRDGTLVLETEFATASGRVRVVDCMPPGERRSSIVRIVEGLEGRVEMALDLVIRFDYGWVVPWVRRHEGALLHAVGGPDALALRTPVRTRGENLTTVAEFEVAAGQRVPFVLTWYASHETPEPGPDAEASLEGTERFWREWIRECHYQGRYRQAVVRSLVTLKALTYEPTGGIVAAPTTSLPEWIGGVRNWDYRYCWVRDATFTLYALMLGGFDAEARAWRDWLVRAVAGTPAQMRIMYGVRGERRLDEVELDWLPGYEGSRPVRAGNAAVDQHQLDVYGEVMDAMHVARKYGVEPDPVAWHVQRHLLDYLESDWQAPDQGIWESRGPRQHFTHSKIMAWVAFDRAVKAVERFGADGPIERWRALRAAVHDEVCRRGYDPARNTFVQAYGAPALDASLLMIPLVGFLPARDPRVAGTVAAIERELTRDGFVQRYPTERVDDGLPAGEAAFLPCSFWLADNYALMGRADEARALFERLLAVGNDVGLFAEEYDVAAGRMLGNFPQAFTHVGLINTAFNLTPHETAPAAERASECDERR